MPALVLILPCTFNIEISDGFQDAIQLPLKLYSRPQMNWQSLEQHLFQSKNKQLFIEQVFYKQHSLYIAFLYRI